MVWWVEERPSAARRGAMPLEWDSDEVKEKVSMLTAIIGIVGCVIIFAGFR